MNDLHARLPKVPRPLGVPRAAVKSGAFSFCSAPHPLLQRTYGDIWRPMAFHGIPWHPTQFRAHIPSAQNAVERRCCQALPLPGN